MHLSDGIVWNESVIKVESVICDLVNIPHANDFSVLDVFDAFVEGDAGDECVAMFLKVGLSTTSFVALPLLFSII